MPSMLCSHSIENPLGKPQGPTMPSFLDDRVDSDAILEDIRSIVEIESPSRSAPGVNRVLETIARLFEGTSAAWERELTTDSFDDILLVRCDPTRNEPGILVLSHMDTVHPVGTLTGKLTYRREGDRVYGPGIYERKCPALASRPQRGHHPGDARRLSPGRSRGNRQSDEATTGCLLEIARAFGPEGHASRAFRHHQADER